MSSDTWSDIQAHKSRQSSLREKIARRRKEREETFGSLTVSPTTAASGADGSASDSTLGSSPLQPSAKPPPKLSTAALIGSPPTAAKTDHVSTPSSGSSKQEPVQQSLSPDTLQQIEQHLLVMLSDITLVLPVEVSSLMSSMTKTLRRDPHLSTLADRINTDAARSAVEDLLNKFAAQMLISLEYSVEDQNTTLVVESVDYNKLSAVTNEMDWFQDVFSRKRKKDSDESEVDKTTKQQRTDRHDEDLIENLLSMESAKQRETKKTRDEILLLLSKPTAKEQSLIEKFKSQGGAQVKEFCPNGTKEECKRVNVSSSPCDKLHFRKILSKHTDESLGDCSFLNTCFHMDTCKYVHYEIDYPDHLPTESKAGGLTTLKSTQESTILFPPQWIQCDLRLLDMTILGKFAVVMADPPWDIHMELPYGTMSDDEMRKLQVPILQDEGYIFLWVTGRAMELGRECLQLWGYERADELIWVKTNQLQRIIRTGRTGHWLNHGKEHCLIGVKGNPKTMNRGLDCDVIVAEVRATSHKPDEIYGIIERLSPGTRKIELFGRPHNVQPNWFTLGNQLDGVKLNEPDVVKAFKARYPDGKCM